LRRRAPQVWSCRTEPADWALNDTLRAESIELDKELGETKMVMSMAWRWPD
jgi:hypothetical protein